MNFLRRPFRYRFDSVVYWIIGINVLVFLGEQVLGRGFFYYFLAMNPMRVMNGWVWSFFSYMFVHDAGDFSHILFNMFALFVFGIPVERRMGSGEFILFYVVTGILAGFFSFLMYFFTGALGVNLMGASGAIFAVQLAFAVFFPDSVVYLMGILPLKAPVMVLGFTGLGILRMVTGSGGNVAHFTHLAGFAFAWLYFLLRFGVNPWKRLTGR
jgi:membrane associated rhomboid family serine protease